MTQDISVTFSAQDQGVIAYLQKQQAEVLKNQERLIKLGQEGKKAGKFIKDGADEGAAGFSNLAARIGTMITGAAAARVSINLLTKEFRNLKEAQADSAKAQTDRAQALRNAAFALGGDPTMDAPGLEKALVGISGRAGVSVRDLAVGAADVLSARGDATPAQALKALESAARLAPDQPGNLGTFAASALDISKATGQTADQALGQILSVGSQSRVTSLKGITENIAPALIGLTKFGDDPRNAGALVAAVSQGGVDPTGATSRTSAISLAAQLEKFLPDLKSTFERIAAVQGSDELRSKFLAEASFEKAFIPVARGLLSGDANTAERRALAAAQQNIKQGPAAEAELRKTLDSINSLPSVQSARIGLAVESTKERLQALDTAGAQASISREAIGSLLKASGATGFAQSAALSAFEAESLGGSVDPATGLANRLRVRAGTILNPLPAGGVGIGPSLPVTASVSPLNQARAEELRVVADLLESILEETKKNRPNPPAQAPRGGNPGAPPAKRPSALLGK